MSQYKSAIRAQPPSDLPDNPKYRQQARQLQELFPAWSNDGIVTPYFRLYCSIHLFFSPSKQTFTRSSLKLEVMLS